MKSDLVREWNNTAEKLPPDDQVVIVMNGQYEVRLKRRGNLWWFPDDSMYVYYTPKIWRLDE